MKTKLSTKAQGRREIRVDTSTHVVGVSVALFLIFAGIGGVFGDAKVIGIFAIIAAPIVLTYFSFQKIYIEKGVMTYRRPFFQTQRIELSCVSEVKTVWDSATFYRRLLFVGDQKILCAFNPKLFSLEDLAFIMEEVSLRAPDTTIDEDARAFLSSKSTKS